MSRSFFAWVECSSSAFRENISQSLSIVGKRVIALDFPGFGKSDPMKNLSFFHFSEIIEELMTYLGIEKLTLIGFCMGGAIALDFVNRHRKRVEQLILIEVYVRFPLSLYPLLAKKLGSSLFCFMTRSTLGEIFLKKVLLLKKKYSKKFFFWIPFKKRVPIFVCNT